ncbi:MAG: ABC transporter ATP-binding protein, partial [Candidatus Woesearchaeota archaeon]
MYAGKVVEYTDVYSIFKNPQHPYTIGLLNSIPKLEEEKERLEPIDGQPPNLVNLPKGCSFAPRCKEAQSICTSKEPDLYTLKPGHQVRCLLREGNK